MATIPELLDGHITLEVECLDRLYLNGYIGRLATGPELSMFMRNQLAVHVDSLKPQTPYRLGPVDFVLPELDRINKCAYWDYQRDRIYIRSNPRLRRVARRNQRKKRRRVLPVNVTVSPSRPRKCPGCASNRITMNGRHSKLLYDLRFSTGGVKRWVSKYIIDHYKCQSCGKRFPSDVYERSEEHTSELQSPCNLVCRLLL